MVACLLASNSPVAAVRFSRIFRFFLLLCGILWVADNLAVSVSVLGASPFARDAWGGAPCTSWEAQQSSRQWEPGWEANVAEQDEVLPYTVVDELQPLGATSVTKDEAAWLDPELNATFGGHPDFKEEHWEEMRAVLRRCKDCFANTPHDLKGYTDEATHNTFSIPFKDDSKAVYQRPRKYSPGEQEIIDIHCKELLEYGFIEPASKHCRHASNVVVAGKKDHASGLWTQTRFCVDLRAINRQSLKDNTLPHRPEELYQKVAKAKFKTTLDATKAFHQIPMATEEDRDKQDGVLVEEPAHCTVAYVDDIVIYTDTTAEQHLKDVEEVLQTLANAGIRLHSGKSTFGVATVDFLGYRIGHNSIGAQEAKCNAIQDLPRPQDKTGLRSILGMMNYYKGLVGEPGGPNYSEMTRPLEQIVEGQHLRILQGQHLRWAISLQESDFTVQYRPGAKNSNADVPSRYPLPSTTDETGARHEREKASALHAGVGEFCEKSFCDSLCFALAGDPPTGMEATPEVHVANYCKMVRVYQLTLCLQGF
eukprot:gene34066-biopygen9257